MKLEKFKEKDNKRTSIIVFTIVCILLVSGVILYRTFAIFEVNTTQNIINGNVESMGDLEFVFYKDDVITKTVPEENDYVFDSSKSYCLDRSTGSQVSNVSWNKNAKSIELNDMSELGKVKCYLHFNKIYQESELNGAIPDLGNGRLVPITLNETGQAVKADIMNTDTPWYSYVDKKWANAVILRDGLKDTYEPGTLIKEEDIESYFVWIPRYEYKIWNGQAETNEFTGITNLGIVENATTKDKLNQAQEINIRFVTKEDTIKYGINKEEWLTHPAFTAFDVNGMWVGKFETSKSENKDYDSISPESVQIKPGVSSWRNIRIANAFYTTYDYKRALDSHMMKNMEWGAVAYLTNSKYGRCDGKGACGEVKINNSRNFVTGSSAVQEPTCGYTGTNIECNKYGTDASIVNSYNNSDSVASSTTNNYYGVFDMAGSAWEYVMGVMVDQNGKPASGRHNVYNSGFVGTLTCPDCTDTNVTPDKDKTTWTIEDKGLAWQDSRYYDTYGYKTSSQYYEGGHLGDGTAEFGPFYQVHYKTGSGGATIPRQVSGWNADGAFFVNYSYPLFRRGGDYADGTDAGISDFVTTDGHAYSDHSFRVVLTP